MQRGPSSTHFLEGGSEDVKLGGLGSNGSPPSVKEGEGSKNDHSMQFNKEIIDNDNLFNVSKKPPSVMNKSNSALGMFRRIASPQQQE